MKPQNSVLTLLIVTAFYVLTSWFVVMAPYSKVKDVLGQLPTIANEKLVALYPRDLQISVKKGIVSVNQKTPYCLIVDQKSGTGVVFDPISVPDISLLGPNSIYKKLCLPMALVGKNFVLYPDKQQSYKIQTISPEVSFEVDRTKVSSFVAEILPKIVSFGQTAYFVGPFVVILLMFLLILNLNTWYALIVYLAAKVFKVNPALTFRRAYTLSLFFYNFVFIANSIIISLVLNQISHLNIHLNFPFLYTIIITLASIFYLKSQSPSLPDSGPTPKHQTK